LSSIHTLDIYNDHGRIHALLSGVATDGGEIVLRHLASADGGRSWSVPVTVNCGIAPAKPSRRGNDFQLAASGQQIVVAWQTLDKQKWITPMVIALSRDGGKSWQAGPNPAGGKPLINQGYIDIAADREGEFHIVWLDDREEHGNFQGLRYAKGHSQAGGLVWEAQKTLDESTCTCCWTAITMSSDRNLHVLYRDHEPRDMALAGSSDAGASWKTLGSVGGFNWQFAGCPHRGGGIAAMEQNRRVHLHTVVWNGNVADSGLYYLRSMDGGRHWEVPWKIHDALSGPGDVALLDAKRVGIVYTVEEQDRRQVMLLRSNDGGKSWSKAQPLSAPGAKASHPRLIANPGGYRAFWSEQRDNGVSEWMTALFATEAATMPAAPSI